MCVAGAPFFPPFHFYLGTFRRFRCVSVLFASRFFARTARLTPPLSRAAQESDDDEIVRKTTLREVKVLRSLKQDNVVNLKVSRAIPPSRIHWRARKGSQRAENEKG